MAQILFFKIMPSQEILKIHDGTPLEAEEILTYIKKPSKYNIVQKKRVAQILLFKIRLSQEILKNRDGTPLDAEEILTYIKKALETDWFDVPSNIVQKKRVARILFFKIRPSQEILKIHDGTPLEKKRVARILFSKIRPSQEILKNCDGTPLEAEEILTYIKNPRNGSIWHFSSKLYVPSNVVQKKRVARILFFKIRPSQEILKIHDGTPLELDVPSNIVQKKRVARILFFKIRPSQEILKIHDVQKKRVARILFSKIRPSQEILKNCDGTPLEAEEILTYIKNPRNGSVWHFSSKLYVPSNVVQKKRVARILFFKIRPSQEILKIHDGTPLEAEEILTYIKSNIVQKKRVARILFFKIRPSQEILKIHDGTPLEKRVARILFSKIRPSQEILKNCDGTPLEAEEILTYIKNPRNGSIWHFSSKLYVPSNVVQKKRVARILFFKIRPSQEILKIHDGTPLELDVPSNIVQKKRVARILFFKIRPSQEILKIHDVQKKRVARILFSKIRPSQEILKNCDGTPLEAEEILTYIKNPRNGSVWHFSSKLYVPSNVVQKKRVARILFFKIRPSQEILKIHDGTPLEKRVARILFFKIRPSQEILKIHDGTPLEKRVARILFSKIRPSQEILKNCDGTPLEAEEILTYIKNPRNGSIWHFSSKLYVPSNVVQKKRVARILFFKIRPSQEILKIHDGTPLEAEEILTYIKRPSQEILKIRDGTPLEAEEILTYIKNPRNGYKKRVARILFFKIRPSQEILKIHDVQKKRVARILFSKIRPSQEILKNCDGTPLEAEEILTYIKNPRNGSVWHFSSNLYVPSNVVQKKGVARILFFKIRPSQEILKIHDGTPLEAEEILTYIKRPSKYIGWALF
ncbi:hypothetical protein OROHE_015215 [Orobanche hederae]